MTINTQFQHLALCSRVTGQNSRENRAKTKKIENMTIPISLVLLALLTGESSCRMVSDPKQLSNTFLRKSEDKKVFSLVERFAANQISGQEEEEGLYFGSLLTGEEGEVRKKEKEVFKKLKRRWKAWILKLVSLVWNIFLIFTLSGFVDDSLYLFWHVLHSYII